MNDEAGWLIEMKFGDGLLWWNGEFDRAGDDYQRARLIARMVNDAGKAVRFARREDAQRVLDGMFSARPCPIFGNAPTLYSVQEHMWPAPAHPEQRAADWTEPTSYYQRMSDAITLLCAGKRPPEKMVFSWLDSTSEELQEFCIEHGPAWAQGIVLIDAARVMADTPTEGVDHEAHPPAQPSQPEQQAPVAAQEVSRLRAELARAERRAITYADILERHCHAMQAAVIEESVKGAAAGMRWISNTLIGPGLYPDIGEALGLSEDDPAQAWFDAKVTESEAFRSAHPAPPIPAAHSPAQPEQQADPVGLTPNRSAFEAAVRKSWTAGYACERFADGAYKDDTLRMAWYLVEETFKAAHPPAQPQEQTK